MNGFVGFANSKLLQLVMATLIGAFGHMIIASKNIGSLNAVAAGLDKQVTEMRFDLAEHEDNLIQHESGEDKTKRIREEFKVLSEPMVVQLKNIEEKIDEIKELLK
jgi:hypothetical protein